MALTVRLARSFLAPNFTCNFMISSKYASKSPGQSQKRKKNKDRRLQVMPGTWVNERDILATQHRLDYHPGLNCGIDPRDNSIFALRAGTVYVTTERIEPDLNHPIAQKFYADRVGQVIHKRHINVIPKQTDITFRLVDLV